MSEPGQKLLELSPQEIKAGLTPAVDAFLRQTDEYAEITPLVRELIDRGRHKALYVPAVKFILSATIDMLSQPAVEERMSKEIGARSIMASHFSKFPVHVGLNSGIFAHFYSNNPDLKDSKLLADRSHLLSDPEYAEYLEGLGSAPFFDSSIASGGAFKFLKEQGVNEDLAGVIERSTGLLAVAGVDKDNADAAFDRLGVPYARTEIIRFDPDADETEVTFTDETIAFLSSLHVKGGGCPSGRVMIPGNPNISLLEDYWPRMVRFLVPPNATADLPQE